MSYAKSMSESIGNRNKRLTAHKAAMYERLKKVAECAEIVFRVSGRESAAREIARIVAACDAGERDATK